MNSISVIIPSSNLRQDLEDNHFDNNSEYDKDRECNSDHVNHHSERLFF